MKSDRQRLFHSTLAAITLLANAADKATALAAGENAHLFLKLCGLVNLAERPQPQQLSSETAKAAYLSIVKLNSSVGNQHWQQVLKGYNEAAKAPNAPEQQATPHEATDPRQEYWKEAAKQVPGENERQAILGEAHIKPPTEQMLAAYRKLLRPIAEDAFLTYKAVLALTSGPDNQAAATATEALKRAAYGRADFTETNKQIKDANPDSSSLTTRQLLCGAATTSAKVTTVAQAILCICAYDSGSTKWCEDTQSTTPLNVATNAHTLMGNLLSLCPQTANHAEQPSAMEVASKLAGVTAEFKSAAKDIYMGHFTQTGCDGTTGNGVCVMYKADTQADQSKVNGIQWIKELHQAATKLRQHEAAQHQLKWLEDRLELTRKRAYSLMPLVQAEIAELSEVTRAENKATNHGQQAEDSKCSDGKNRSATECQTLDCDHDTASNKCTPKKTGAASTAAAATGEKKDGDNTGKPVCSSFINQTACNNGQNCKWENNACKDSSFLVSKQFALMVSSAFAALLF